MRWSPRDPHTSTGGWRPVGRPLTHSIHRSSARLACRLLIRTTAAARHVIATFPGGREAMPVRIVKFSKPVRIAWVEKERRMVNRDRRVKAPNRMGRRKFLPREQTYRHQTKDPSTNRFRSSPGYTSRVPDRCSRAPRRRWLPTRTLTANRSSDRARLQTAWAQNSETSAFASIFSATSRLSVSVTFSFPLYNSALPLNTRTCA